MFKTAVISLLLLVICTPVVLGQNDDADRADHEAFLIPIFFDGPGAAGSLWDSELWIQNRSGVAVETGPQAWYDRGLECRFGAPCPAAIPPGALYEPPVESYFSPRGRTGLLLYAPTEHARDLTLSLRVHDRNLDASSAGVEIPIVHESEFSDELALLNVPADDRFRTTLRLYSLKDRNDVVILRFLPMDSDDILAEEQVTLSTPYGEAHEAFPLSPAFAELSMLTDLHPVLQTIDDYRIEIVSPDGSLVWGFLSLTNNQTSQITLVTP